MTDQEKFAAAHEALAAAGKPSGPRDQRYEMAFRRYLAAIGYHDGRRSASDGPAVGQEHDTEPHREIGEIDTNWDLHEASVGDVMTRDVVSSMRGRRSARSSTV